MITDHEFLPVLGHPDDPECTYRADGTDATYCGQPWDQHAATSLPIDALIEASSLGTPAAKALRDSVSQEHAERIVARANKMRGSD